MRHLKRTWKAFYRIRLGKGYGKMIGDMRQWCREQPSHFYHSDGAECWYFDDLNTAIYFKLRWHI